MVNIGDLVEIALNKASPKDIESQRPGTYQLEPDRGEVVSEPFTDDYGVEYAMVQVFRGDKKRLNRIPVRKLKVYGVADTNHGTQENHEPGSSAPRYFGEVG